jgi:hypothetical protein
MKNKSNLWLLLLLLAVAGVAYVVYQTKGGKSTLKPTTTDFAVKDTTALQRIFISGKNGTNLLLERANANKWILNKKFEARDYRVSSLLDMLARMEVKRPVTNKERNTVIRYMASDGYKIELYDKNGLLKTFYAGGNTMNEKGTYFLLPESETPYVLHIPGFDGYLDIRLRGKVSDWKTLKILESPLPDIEEISITYPKTPANNILIKKEGGKLVLQDAPNQDPAKVQQYSAQFNSGFGEQYLDDLKTRFKDSVTLQVPFCEIKVKDRVPARSRHITMYPVDGKTDRWIALMGPNRDWGTLQEHGFGRFLATKKDFMK